VRLAGRAAGMTDGAHLTRVNAVFWRMTFVIEAERAMDRVRSPEGRSHHDGQRALYLSETPEGCVVAVRRYMRPDDPPRVFHALRVRSDRIVDLRDAAACAHFGIDVTHRAAEWQNDRAAGRPASTWAISDRVRDLGQHGMLYASRSQPGMTHLTLFSWNDSGGTKVQRDGAAIPWNGS
jgi:hypothetical protein